MKGLPTTEERRVILTTDDLPPGHYPRVPKSRLTPKQVAMLSILPGLGQIYNGELGKGLMFVGVSLANAVLLSALTFHHQVTDGLAALAVAFHMQPQLMLTRPLETAHAGSPAFCIYLALIALYVAYSMREAYEHAAYMQQGSSYPRFFLGLPEVTSGSYLGHFLVLAIGLVFSIFFAKPSPPPNQITDIELVQPIPEPPAKKPPAPPKPKEQPKQEEVQKPKPVVQPKPHPQPVAIATTAPDAPPDAVTTEPQAAPPPAPAPTGGAAGGDDGGGSGGGGEDVDMGPYLADLQRKIKKAWFPPKGNESKRITVSFKIQKNGSIRSLKLKKSSGLDIADEAALTAVEKAQPFGDLPKGAGDEIDLNFTFDYNVFGGAGN